MKHLSKVSMIIGVLVAAACLVKGRSTVLSRKPGGSDRVDNPKPEENEDKKSVSSHPPSYDDIALRAYFIALARAQRGQCGDALEDWMEAERQLTSGDDAGV